MSKFVRRHSLVAYAPYLPAAQVPQEAGLEQRSALDDGVKCQRKSKFQIEKWCVGIPACRQAGIADEKEMAILNRPQ